MKMRNLFDELVKVYDVVRDAKKQKSFFNDVVDKQLMLPELTMQLCNGLLPKKQYIINGEEIWVHICSDFIRAYGVFYAITLRMLDGSQYIIVDEDFIRDFSDEEQDVIIAHELGHVKDGDFQAHAIASNKTVAGYILCENIADEYAVYCYGADIVVSTFRKTLDNLAKHGCNFRFTNRMMNKRIDLILKNHK